MCGLHYISEISCIFNVSLEKIFLLVESKYLKLIKMSLTVQQPIFVYIVFR